VRHLAITSAANLVVSRESQCPGLFVFDDLNGLFLAPRAFKGTQIVSWLIGGLYTGEPHLSATGFAKRQAHQPQPRTYLIRSQSTPQLLFAYLRPSQSSGHYQNTYRNAKFVRRRRLVFQSRDWDWLVTKRSDWAWSREQRRFSFCSTPKRIRSAVQATAL
jgi:hypothetical protein